MRTVGIAAMVLLAIISLFAVSPALAQYIAPHTKPGPASDVVTYKRVDQPLAISALKAGDIDIYTFGLRGAAAKAALGDPSLKLYTAPSGLNDIVLNPAPAPEGQINPFSNKNIRFAMQYIFNREFFVSDVFAGLAAPMVTFLSQYDPDYVTIFDIVAKYDFKYDPALAAQIVDREMTNMGAVKVAGKWQFNGKPVTLNFIIRVEDERRQIGDAFAAELEKLGFTVNRIYLTFGPAIDKVYGTDPKDFEWHLYTEGWRKTGVDKYDSGTINQYVAPWAGYMPGWQEPGFWNYANSTLDEIGQRIYTGNFTSKEERDALYRKLTEMGIQESIRVWGITQLTAYATRADVTGITNDIGAGLAAWHVVRNAYVPGRTGTLNVGHLWVWTETTAWNPVGGFIDVYSADPAASTCDPAIYVHPFNGLPMPVRASYDVTTAGPEGSLPVPADAVIWNNATKAWTSVGSGVTAKSKVIFDYSKFFASKWHHNITIGMADLLYNLAAQFDLAFDSSKAKLEPAIASALEPGLKLIKGIRILPDLRVEVYVDYWHFDPNYIASAANVWVASSPCMAVPWEIRAAMDRLVFEKKSFAYSQSASRARAVPWLSVVLPDHAKALADTLNEMKAQGFFPSSWFTVGGVTYETSAGAASRFDAALGWYSKYGIMWISDGPYMLTKFDAKAQFLQLTAFRDPTYPFRPGFFFFGLPQPVEIVSVGTPTIVPGGEATILVDVKGPGTLGTLYLLKDPTTGSIIAQGSGVPVAPTRFVITLSAAFTKTLKPGSIYELTVAAFSDQVAFVTASKQFLSTLNVGAITGPITEEIEKRLGALSSDLAAAFKSLADAVSGAQTSLTTRINGVEGSLTTAVGALDQRISSLQSTVQSLLVTAYAILGVAVIALIISVAALLRRPKGGP